jgi:hypothetical protein
LFRILPRMKDHLSRVSTTADGEMNWFLTEDFNQKGKEMFNKEWVLISPIRCGVSDFQQPAAW